MTKLIFSLLTILFMTTLSFALPQTEDMKATADEYENSSAQWYVKEALGILMEQISYEGWEAKKDKKGNEYLTLRFKNTFTGKYIKKDYGNSEQLLKPGLDSLIGDKKAPITEAEAKTFYSTIKQIMVYADLRVRYDQNHDSFKEEFQLLNDNKIIKFKTEGAFLQKNDSLATWKDGIIDKYNGVDDDY